MEARTGNLQRAIMHFPILEDVLISRTPARKSLWGAFEILNEGRTQPTFHLPLCPPIPIAFVFGSSPNESGSIAWKGSCREDDFESVCGVRDVFCQHVQNVVSPADKRFPHKAGSCVIENPYS